MNKNDIIKARASVPQAKFIFKELAKETIIEDLKHQLTEKDKEISTLKRALNYACSDLFYCKKIQCIQGGLPEWVYWEVARYIQHAKQSIEVEQGESK